jgi:hypothetical protein
MLNDSTRAARCTVAIIAMAGLALLAAACGGSSGGSSAGSANSQSPISQALAFSRCMRSHGVPSFPDPNSSGVFDKPSIYELSSSPKFQPATQACGHLLPDGGPGVPPSPAVVQQIQADMVKFARCMRSDGVPNWPDPTLDRGRAVFDPEAVGIDTNSAQISAKMRECERVFPASIGIPPGA